METKAQNWFWANMESEQEFSSEPKWLGNSIEESLMKAAFIGPGSGQGCSSAPNVLE